MLPTLDPASLSSDSTSSTTLPEVLNITNQVTVTGSGEGSVEEGGVYRLIHLHFNLAFFLLYV